MTVELDSAKDIISQLKEIKIKAIILAGGGEPSCHPNLEEIIKFIKRKGIECAINTNAYELSPSLIETIVTNCTWARISLDGDNSEIYKKTHGMDEDAFNQVVENASKLVEVKNQTNSNIVLGTTYLLGQNTLRGIYNAAELSKKIGVNYIRFRPFEGSKQFRQEEKEEMLKQLKRCKEIDDEKFLASYREDRCEAVTGGRERKYTQCFVPHFVTAITADLKVYPCCIFRNNEKYCLGDLTKQTFKEIWLSKERKKVHEKIDLRDCPNPCQFEGHNNLLYAIKNNNLKENINLLEILRSVNEFIPHSNFL